MILISTQENDYDYDSATDIFMILMKWTRMVMKWMNPSPRVPGRLVLPPSRLVLPPRRMVLPPRRMIWMMMMMMTNQ